MCIGHTISGLKLRMVLHPKTPTFPFLTTHSKVCGPLGPPLQKCENFEVGSFDSRASFENYHCGGIIETEILTVTNFEHENTSLNKSAPHSQSLPPKVLLNGQFGQLHLRIFSSPAYV